MTKGLKYYKEDNVIKIIFNKALDIYLEDGRISAINYLRNQCGLDLYAAKTLLETILNEAGGE